MPTPVGLTTLENLRLHVLRSSEDDSADDKLTLYGEMMSERVTDWCAREFAPDPADPEEDDPVARVIGYDGDGNLDLSPYDLRELTAIGFVDGDTTNEIPASQYRLIPAAKGGTYLSIDVAPYRVPLSPVGIGWQVEVTGYWGMLTVPKPVELAVLIAVDNVMKNPGSWAGQQLGGYTVTSDPVLAYEQDPRGGLPREALYAAKPYKRTRRIGSIALRHPWPYAVAGNVANWGV